MKPGDRITIVHSIPPDGISLGTIVDPIDAPWRTDAGIAVRTDGADASSWLRFPASMIDVGNIHVTPSPRHRVGDPETARLAAQAAEERLTAHQWAVLEALVHAGRTGMIDHEHEAHNGLIPTSAGKRRKELERLGLCEPTSRTRTTGRALATVHQITARGQAVWQHHQRGAA